MEAYPGDPASQGSQPAMTPSQIDAVRQIILDPPEDYLKLDQADRWRYLALASMSGEDGRSFATARQIARRVEYLMTEAARLSL